MQSLLKNLFFVRVLENLEIPASFVFQDCYFFVPRLLHRCLSIVL